MQVLAHPQQSSHSSRHSLPRLYIGIIFTCTLLLALAAGLFVFSSSQTAFAQGATEILTTDSALKVVFTGVSTNDPAGSPDPGQTIDTGRCQARLDGAGALSLTLYNGYPGYTCTLRARPWKTAVATVCAWRCSSSPPRLGCISTGRDITAPPYCTPGKLSIRNSPSGYRRPQDKISSIRLRSAKPSPPTQTEIKRQRRVRGASRNRRDI